jgi:DNA polymerase I
MSDLAGESLLLVDGSGYLYRAFHALPDLRNAGGEPTGALYGVATMLRRLRADQRLHGGARFGAVIFDAPGRTFRDDLYDQYKANRASMPEELARQIGPLKELVSALGWPVLVVEGVEADDVIGTISSQARALGMRSVIATGDKDLAQLVDDHCVLVNTMTRDGSPPEPMDATGVQERFGVPPDRIVDWLALVGDTVDNVPGVPKVGPKTAVKWIAEHGSLDGIMAAADRITGVVGENLREALPWLPTARDLVTVRCDCDLSTHLTGPEALLLQTEDDQRLLTFYERWGFRSWQKELRARLGGETQVAGGVTGIVDRSATPDVANEPPGPPQSVQYETVLSVEQLDDWIERIQSCPLVGFDTETTSLDPMAAQLVGLSLAVAPGIACYVPVGHRYTTMPDQLPLALVLERLRPWLEDPLAAKVGQHLKYDTHVLQNHGIKLAGIAHDTLLESYVFEAHRRHDLGSLAERWLGRATVSYEDVAGKGASQISFEQVPVEVAAHYAAEDADVTLHLHQHLWPKLQAEPRLAALYQTIELPVARVLQRMERHGVLVDCAMLEKQGDELAVKILQLERHAQELAGQPFNLGSPKQLGELLFDRLKLPVVKKTAGGAPSTDEEVLEKLALDFPLPRAVLDWRSLSKLKSTYVDKLPRMVNARTGRVHTSYAQAVAVTGRLASSEPNLQNIPIRTPEGRRIREAFIAPPGWSIVSADYSQIELRIMAHLSDDEALLRAFNEGQDVHRATAAEVFGTDPAHVTSEQRRYAKVINFGLIYGMTAFGLAQNLGIGRDAAKSWIDRYFQRYPGVARYMEQTRERAKRDGYVETVFGRRLWLPEINSPNGPRRAGAERAAINAPMQGTAADLIKLAMISVQDVIDQEGRQSRLIMQVHDELVLEVPPAELDWARVEIPARMAAVASMKVPLLAEVGVGPNWDQAH